MKHEERNPMKLIKKFIDNALMIFMSAFILTLVISILGQALALGFYAIVVIIGIGALAYLLIRSPN